ncbi:Crp/Fnr family transcriptional regulator [Tenacibaculum sp. AHE15PA]|uniref:Crp/Fnr family transcriptional regulator n=1 Tax=unclassified Tenacibaculum TaxID=2635139 RepID=UPI001C4EF116|nr:MULTISPECIES: Crp/Fnr family transcriptional regulator [unclassified Tenacibaculum]QXP73815.1 Crp/Fnr family transcriptional regulator [Tenacibaculum sp. AHE14PA]QXP75818.1 Crp/Fnr family transcriptional regulator [Tenacibaculum sp. AHE15PA]
MYQSILKHIQDHITPTKLDLERFNEALNKVSISKGQFLLKPGTTVKHEYFVIKGCLKAYYLDDKGSSHIIQFAIENWWVGDFDAFYNKISSKLYIEAIEDSELLAINYDSLQNIYDKAPIFERYFRILTTQAFISQRKRILSTLEKNTQERYLEFCTSYPKIEDRVPNYDIANYLGVSPENLSRVRQQIKS